MDAPQPERIRDDLKGILAGDILVDDLSRALYSTDASLFEVRPAAVVVPRDEEDVQTLVRYAAEHQVPLVPRGAGTGMSGEALGPGVVVDLSKHFRSILEVGPDTVRVQPGVTLYHLQAELARQGRRLAPDPALGECTLGGMLATNASGANAFRHGTTRDHVRSLRLVLDTGSVAEVSRQPRFPVAESPADRLEDIVSALATLLEQHHDVLAHTRPPSPFHHTGYHVHDILDDDHLDLARLLVGSEGTLGIFTEAVLGTIPLCDGQALVLLAFDSLDAALQAARLVREAEPSACELLDRRLLRLAREGRRGRSLLSSLLPPPAALLANPFPADLDVEAVLLVEFEAETPAEARERGHGLARRLHQNLGLAHVARVADNPVEMEPLRQLRQAVLPGMYGLRGGATPVAIVEDIRVPPDLLPVHMFRAQEVLHKHETTASFLVHPLTGQVHLRPFLDLSRPEEVARLWSLADDIHDLALELGGTISSQLGLGLARTPWLARQVGRLYPLLRELKAIFDPHHIFNPGKIIRTQGSPPPWPLRRRVRDSFSALVPRASEVAPSSSGSGEAPETEQAETSRTQGASVPPTPRMPLLHWKPGELAAEVSSCNGCGECRAEAPHLRMCPVFRATLTPSGSASPEAATPRAKANLLRHLLHPDTDPHLLSSDAAREVADLCINCKMCARECPAHVDIPRLMLEAKAANVAEHGINWTNWTMARSEHFARLGSALAPFVNVLLTHPVVRWLLEKFLGISRKRRLPRFVERSFLRRARARGWTHVPHSARPRVAYFVDVFANYNDPSIAEALVAVLHHNGIEVLVPPGQRGCGMAPLAHGDVEAAREALEHNLRILADLARAGYPIVCSEPTAALLFRTDALHLSDDPDVRLVAGQTVEATAFLWDLYQQGQLRSDFHPLPLTVGHHVPCHIKALGRPPVGPALLSLIPGLDVRTIDVSCSGMAGTFGLQQQNYAISLAAGRPMLEHLANPEIQLGSTECSPCRMQMEHGVNKSTLHPVQYLAHAYGLDVPGLPGLPQSQGVADHADNRSSVRPSP